MNCAKCGKEENSYAPCECGGSEAAVGRPGLWLLITIIVTGMVALAVIWGGVPVDESTIDSLVARSKDLRSKESFAEAVETLRQAQRLRPKRADIHHELAKALMENGQPAEAILQLQETCKLAPDNYEAQEMYGEALESNEGPVAALRQFDIVMKKFPDKSAPRQHAAELQEELGHKDEALVLWRQAAALDAADEVPRIKIAEILSEKGQFQSALQELDNGLKSAPDSPDLYFHKGMLLANEGKREDAKKALNRAIELEPQYSKEITPILDKLSNATGEAKFYLVPLKETIDGLIVQAIANNKVTLNLVLDSGASSVVLSEDAAAKLQLDISKLPTQSFKSVTGVDRAPLGAVDLQVGGASAKAVESTFYTMPHQFGANHVDGLLGMSFLKRFKFTVDRDHEQLVLCPK